MKKLTPYNTEGTKLLRTDIDGHFSCRVSNQLTLSKGDTVEIKGRPELYKIQRIIEDIPHNPSFQYYIDRKCDEILECKLMKSVDLYPLTLKGRIEEAEWLHQDYDSSKFKPNYIYNGVEIQFDGKLNKNQIVRLGDRVIRITELNKLGNGVSEVLGEEITREVLTSVHRLLDEDMNLIDEYENYGDWLIANSRMKSIQN